jgi:DNA repair protein RecN (Recombination protein N)
MLETLHIVNLGQVDELTLELDEGLTVLTGETGVGKTLLVDALHLVLGGERAVPARDDGAASKVEAIFSSSGGDVVLARERSAKGRLRATVDGSLVAASALAATAEALCELHGQHEHQVLRAPGAARALLDRSGGVDDAELRRLRARHRDLLAARERLGGTAEERARRLDLVAHECAEIDAAAIVDDDELDRLLDEAAALAALLDAREALAAAAARLDGDGDDPSAAALVAEALAGLPRDLVGPRDEVAAVLETTRAAAHGLRAELERVEADPGRAAALDERIGLLQALVRKHGARLAEVRLRRDALGQELVALRDDEARSREVDGELADVTAALAVAAEHVLAARRAAASAVADGVRGRLAELALPQARFEVAVEGPAGEQVQFRFAGSSSFAPGPLVEAASGGELSRVMLALTLATRASAPCVVFDEVDAGVGGATARSLAACLAELARTRQVLVVTHLATVAAVAAHHLVVTRSGDGRAAQVDAVAGRVRVCEVARMLAGDPRDPVAIAHAEALLEGDPAVA